MSFPRPPIVLTIAGFDPSSGAGVSADLKTIAAHRCYGMACVTAMTVQNTQGVDEVEPINSRLVANTLASVARDVDFVAIKVGMLGSKAVCEVVRDFLKTQSGIPVVLDPIIRSSSGTQLLADDSIDVLRGELLPLVTVMTPNLHEAESLAGESVRALAEMKTAAKTLQGLGAKNVVITGGHLPENTDVLRLESGEEIEFTGQRIDSMATHGTGCAFSTAIACGLASGDDVREAVARAKDYVRQAILSAYPVGKGTGPLNHLFRLK